MLIRLPQFWVIGSQRSSADRMTVPAYRIDPIFRDFLPPISADERNLLKAQCLAAGRFRDP